MKMIVFLFVVVFVSLSPGFGELAAAELTAVEKAINTALIPVMNELRVMREELSTVKSELAAVKAEVATVKAEVATMKTEFATMKKELFELNLAVTGLKGEVRGNSARITDLREQVSRQANTLTWVAGMLLTVLLTFLGWGFAKWLKDREKSREEAAGLQQQLQAQQAELAALQAELVRLRTENERLKPQIVTQHGEPVQGD